MFIIGFIYAVTFIGLLQLFAMGVIHVPEPYLVIMGTWVSVWCICVMIYNWRHPGR